jgi:predicted glycoside hydrolase/deacetylase ChbG (UPF0249 family)
MSRYLIVNADDFNTDPERNRGILDARVNGIVTSVTVLANLRLETQSLSALREALGGSIGVHLNLTRGRPLTNGGKTLTNEQGVFFSKQHAWTRALLRKYDMMEVETEFSAQIERIKGAGVTPDHIDGNNHIHVFPGLAQAAAKVAHRFNIGKIRLPREPFDGFRHCMMKGGPKKALISALSNSASRIFESFGLKFPDRFAGMQHPRVSDEEALCSFVRELPEGTTELMCHPGYASGGDNPFSNEDRSQETAVLTSPTVVETVRQSGVELISYKDL